MTRKNCFELTRNEMSLRGHSNILWRLLIHTVGFNLELLMWQVIGVGTPRGSRGDLSRSSVLADVDSRLLAHDARQAPCSHSFKTRRWDRTHRR
jgi:hypothetical protein